MAKPGRDLDGRPGAGLCRQAATRSPGRSWHYSNTNYLLLGLVAENVSGAPFAKLVRDRLFGPAGLKDAFVQVAEHPRGPLAMGYYYNSALRSAPPIPLADAARPDRPVHVGGHRGRFRRGRRGHLGRPRQWARALYGGTILKAGDARPGGRRPDADGALQPVRAVRARASRSPTSTAAAPSATAGGSSASAASFATWPTRGWRSPSSPTRTARTSGR